MKKSLLYLILVNVYSFTSADKCRIDGDKDIEYDTTCPSNCSQEPPRIDGDTLFFNCSIGRKEDVDRYKRAHSKQFKPASSIFDAPVIHGVELYWKHFSSVSEIALKFNFSLPIGIDNPNKQGEWLLPQAVLLKFESIPGKHQDEYYANCPRERIFQFYNYNADHAYEKLHPRQLMFDCIMGLEFEGDKTKEYAISLQTAAGKNVTYITTVRTDRAEIVSKDLRYWYPVIMTHLNESDGSLYIIVEKPPSLIRVQGYIVKLVKVHHGVTDTEKINLTLRNTTKFFNLTKGNYTIQVTPVCRRCNKNTTRPMESVIIDARMLPGDPHSMDYPHYLEETMEPLKIVAMVIGCVMGVILLLLITLYIRKRPKCQEKSSVIKQKGLLLHPFEKDSITGEYDVVLKLKRYVDAACDCTVTDCAALHSDETQLGIQAKVERALKESSFVLVLYTSYSYHENATSYVTDFYSCVLNTVVDHRNTHNDLRIIPLRFLFNGNNDFSSVVTPLRINVQAVSFINDPDKVYCKMHGFNKRPPHRKSLQAENKSQWKDLWAELCKMVEQVRNNYDVRNEESEPLIYQLGNMNGTVDVKKLLKDDNKPMPDNIQDAFKQIALINTENDSVIGNDDRRELPRTDAQYNGYSHDTFYPHAEEDEESRFRGEHLNENQVKLLERQKENNKPSGHFNDGMHSQQNIQVCEAEVHYSGENVAISEPLPTRRSHGYDRQLSLPAYNAHDSRDNGLREKRFMRREAGSDKHHVNDEGDQMRRPPDFDTAMSFNIEDTDTEIDDVTFVKHFRANDEENIHFSGTHIIPQMMHGILHPHHYHHQNTALGHHHPAKETIGGHNDETAMKYLKEVGKIDDEHFTPHSMHGNLRSNHYHRQNQEISHRGPSIPNNHVPEQIQEQMSEESYRLLHGNPQLGRHMVNHKPHHFPHGMTHQHILHHGNRSFHQYHPDDYIPRNHDHQDAIPMNEEHIPYFDPENFSENHQQRYHQHHHQQQQHYPGNYLHNNPEQHRKHFKVNGHHVNPSASRGQEVHNFSASENDQSSPPRFSFDACDPRKEQKKEIKKKTENTKNNETDLNASSVSLPMDLKSVSWIEPEDFKSDLRNYSPEPPEEYDHKTESQIMEEFFQINEKNSKK